MRFFKSFIAFLLILATVSMFAHRSTAAQEELRVVALGDSYTAGNGAGDYQDYVCWRSSAAYVHKYASMLHNVNGFDVYSKNFGCMSALIDDVHDQIQNASESLRTADIVLLTIGGNDAHFEEIVKKCVYYYPDLIPVGDNCFEVLDKARGEFDGITDRLRGAYSAIRQKAQNAQIVFIGYPELVSGDCSVIAWNAEQKLQDLQEVGDSLYEQVFSEIQALGDKNVHYLSTLQQSKGHGLCGDKWQHVRGLNSTYFEEVFHPNEDGHQFIADQLYSLGVHALVGTTEPIQEPNDPQPKPEVIYDGYTRLPFDCGTTVPYASTYDTYHHEGITIHHGNSLDFPMPLGTPVVAAYDGTVRVAYDHVGYGHFVDLVNSNGVLLRMAHLTPSVKVSDGQQVKRGQLIGYVGDTGASVGAHLHYERRVNNEIVVNHLGGDPLEWGPKLDSGGFRVTTHTLRSANCESLPGANQGSNTDRFADIMAHENQNVRYGRSDGHDNRNWEVAYQNILDPTVAIACDIDGDGWDEYVSYETPTSSGARIMRGSPNGDGTFEWSKLLGVSAQTSNITCGDWNGDGRDDIFTHVRGNGNIRVALSNGRGVGTLKTLYSGMSPPTYWDICDLNGDGRQDIVSYEGGGGRVAVGHKNSNGKTAWKVIRRDVFNVEGMTCANFTNFEHDEIVLWQPANNGHYKIGRFGDEFAMFNWERIEPQGLQRPFEGELASGDIDGDGFDEFVVNEYRGSRGNHSVMVGDFKNRSNFSWYPFIEGVHPHDLVVGHFVG